MADDDINRDVLAKLVDVLKDRLSADPDESYVASLYAGGDEPILKKIGEEATELVMAGKGDDHGQIIHEAADLLFHTMVLLVHKGLGIDEVLAELENRFGRPGLQEKRQRSGNIEG